MDTAHPLFLTFIQSGSGHYDYALPSNQAKVQALNAIVVEKQTSRGKHVLPQDVHVFGLINHAPFYADVKHAVTLMESAENHHQLGGEWHMTCNGSLSVDTQVIHL